MAHSDGAASAVELLPDAQRSLVAAGPPMTSRRMFAVQSTSGSATAVSVKLIARDGRTTPLDSAQLTMHFVLYHQLLMKKMVDSPLPLHAFDGAYFLSRSELRAAALTARISDVRFLRDGAFSYLRVEIKAEPDRSRIVSPTIKHAFLSDAFDGTPALALLVEKLDLVKEKFDDGTRSMRLDVIRVPKGQETTLSGRLEFDDGGPFPTLSTGSARDAWHILRDAPDAFLDAFPWRCVVTMPRTLRKAFVDPEASRKRQRKAPPAALAPAVQPSVAELAAEARAALDVAARAADAAHPPMDALAAVREHPHTTGAAAQAAAAAAAAMTHETAAAQVLARQQERASALAELQSKAAALAAEATQLQAALDDKRAMQAAAEAEAQLFADETIKTWGLPMLEDGAHAGDHADAGEDRGNGAEAHSETAAAAAAGAAATAHGAAPSQL